MIVKEVIFEDSAVTVSEAAGGGFISELR